MSSIKTHESLGVLRYYNDPLKLIVDVDQGLSDYYRCIIPKYISTNKQRYPAHITVVRNEIPTNMDKWGAYEGKEVSFLYEHYIYSGQVYYWLNVSCKQLEEIRRELGLPVTSPYTRPPGRFDQHFHITIGNTKKL